MIFQLKTLNGIHISHNKNTEDCETIDFPIPKKVIIPMQQHMGAPCTPLVKKGDTVAVGQKIGDSDAFMSAPVHSSVSGEVTAVEDFLNTNGSVCKAVHITSDGKQTKYEGIAPPEISDKQSFIAAVRESGLSGLGGAGFPTHIKLNYDPLKTPIDTLVINAAECEPYITSDYRQLMEEPADVIEGILMIQNMMGIPRCKICIEGNKPKAIKLLKEKTAEIDAIEIITLPQMYPQGAEKVIIYSATSRIVGEGELPANQGVLVMNVSTAAFIRKYANTGIPLVSKRITLDGSAMTKNQGNYIVPIGTPVSELLDFTGAENPQKVLYGGPMMGITLYDTAQPVIKNTNAILAFKDVYTPKITDCIRCGTCIRTCPLKLSPVQIEAAYKQKNVEMLKKLKVTLCMNCGCCTYACPAHRNLAETNQLAKALIPRK